MTWQTQNNTSFATPNDANNDALWDDPVAIWDAVNSMWDAINAGDWYDSATPSWFTPQS